MQVTVKINEIEVTINRPELSNPNRQPFSDETDGVILMKGIIDVVSDKALELLKQTK